MMLKRSEALAKAGVTERELRDLERQGLVVPARSWKTLWLMPYYHLSQIDVIQWLVSCRRTQEAVLAKEESLGISDQ
jgi:DNA-binding transcriptional MerR regulator